MRLSDHGPEAIKRTVTELQTSNDDQPLSRSVSNEVQRANGVDVSEMGEFEDAGMDFMDMNMDDAYINQEDLAGTADEPSSTLQAEVVDMVFDMDKPPPCEPPCAAEGVERVQFLWSFILYLAASLHLRFHVTHRAIDLMLTVISAVLVSLGQFSPTEKRATTLRTVIKQLQLDNHFQISPMCPTCRRIYLTDSSPETTCLACETALFKTKTTLRGDFDGTIEVDELETHEPVLKYPHRSLASQIKELLARDGMEDELDKWKTK
ncbi:hypothetical protein ACEPAG_9045 [Sanghuangporus baumii]